MLRLLGSGSLCNLKFTVTECRLITAKKSNKKKKRKENLRFHVVLVLLLDS